MYKESVCVSAFSCISNESFLIRDLVQSHAVVFGRCFVVLVGFFFLQKSAMMSLLLGPWLLVKTLSTDLIPNDTSFSLVDC